MSKLEKDCAAGIKSVLNTWQITGEVVWYSRLNSGNINIGSRWVKLCEPGTPDFFALVRGRNSQLIGVFIEAKSDTGKLSPLQVKFKERHHNGQDVYVLEVNNPKTLSKFINEIAIDRVKEITL